MKAVIQTYGGATLPSGITTVQHWELIVDGVWLANTDLVYIRDLFQEIADKLNGYKTPETRIDNRRAERGSQEGQHPELPAEQP